MKAISTTALAKIHGITAKELFSYMSEHAYIRKENNSWILEDRGKEKGGQYKESKQYGKYIVWPEDLEINISSSSQTKQTTGKLITATAIGNYFGISANKINFILSEIGWIKKGLKGWIVTVQGKKQGGLQAEDQRTGIPYVRWVESILESNTLVETIGHVKGTIDNKIPNNKIPDTEVGFREKFEAKHRSADGHFVRSKAEMLIDNWLYMAEIVHAYERKLPIEEDVYCDFYIPTGKVYIEYWGYENDQKYLARKEKKIDIYKKYGFNLIELNDKEVQNLDDILPKMLLKYGVQAY